MSETFNYQRYLASREWGLLKRAVRKRSEGQCERCPGEYEETHHLTYERIGHENVADLLAVCRECHRYLSGISDFDPLQDFYEWMWKRHACNKARAAESLREWHGLD